MRIGWFIVVCLGLFSCQNDNASLKAEQAKEAQKKEVVFETITSGWSFNIAPIEPTTQARLNGWMEWRNFLREVNQKPKSTLNAFQKKASVLVTQSEALVNTLPMEFNQPAVRARLKVINTKLKSLDLFIHLNQTPAAKVVKLIGEINTEIEYLQLQFEEIVQRSLIPREPGEPDFVKMKDTTRAIPNTPIIP